MLHITIHLSCIHTQHVFAVVYRAICCKWVQSAVTMFGVYNRIEGSRGANEFQPLSTNLAKSAADWFPAISVTFYLGHIRPEVLTSRAWNIVKHNLQVSPPFFPDWLLCCWKRMHCSTSGHLFFCTSFRSSCSPIGHGKILWQRAAPEYLFLSFFF